MRTISQSTLLTVFIITIGTQYANAQVNLSKWQIGVNGGVMIYQGDLTPEDLGSYRTMQPTASIYVSRVINRCFLLRTNLALGRLKGDDAKYDLPLWRKERNYNFTSPVGEISELLVWNIAGNNGNQLGQRFSPYMFAGVGVSFLKVSRDYSQFNTHYFATATNILNGLNADIQHQPPHATLVLPVGLGMEYYLSPKLSLTAETSLRYTFTDYLDGFSLGANRRFTGLGAVTNWIAL
ncbi:MAG: DUF6089 family protein [Ferruginibacter sp.]